MSRRGWGFANAYTVVLIIVIEVTRQCTSEVSILRSKLRRDYTSRRKERACGLGLMRLPIRRLRGSGSTFNSTCGGDIEDWSLKASSLLHSQRSKYNESEVLNVEDYMSPLFPDNPANLLGFVKDILAMLSDHCTRDDFNHAYRTARFRYKMNPKKAQIRLVYEVLRNNGLIKPNESLERQLVSRPVRSLSGVLVITVFTSPYPKYGNKTQRFSCRHNCFYCPNEPGLPRSYLSDEPGVRRAKRHKFDAYNQFVARATAQHVNGHPIDKIEILVLGGTWSEYPHEYQEEFLRDIFYAANTFSTSPQNESRRPALSLAEEQVINQNASARIIGVTLETRPDSIDTDEIRRMRYLGCTRVQLGIQHTDDQILRHINRGCTLSQAIHAVKLLKDGGFKIDFHLMPDLPSSTVEKDMAMFTYLLESSEMQADQWKIYPCQVTPWTRIERWFREGKYKPYRPLDLLELIVWVKSRVKPWIRLNRVIRDIPSSYVIGGNNCTNLRQMAKAVLAEKGLRCDCIRCREARRDTSPEQVENATLIHRKYSSSNGTEFFLSFESPDRCTIYGFCRLRLSRSTGICMLSNGSRQLYLPEIVGCAMIRELHVYGSLQRVKAREDSQETSRKFSSLTLVKNPDTQQETHAQHMGFGRRLMSEAERIAYEEGYKSCAVIAGIGAREYYKALGYELRGTYMVKELGAVT